MPTELRPFKLKRGTAVQWSATNPVLLDGEPGWDKTNFILKLGDGVTAWSALPAVVDAEDVGAALRLDVLELGPDSLAWNGTAYVVGESDRVFYGPVNPDDVGITTLNGDVWEVTA